MKFCSNCGNQMQDDERFCPNCGTPAASQAAPQQPAYTQPQNVAPQPAAQQQPVYTQPSYTAPQPAPQQQNYAQPNYAQPQNAAPQGQPAYTQQPTYTQQPGYGPVQYGQPAKKSKKPLAIIAAVVVVAIIAVFGIKMINKGKLTGTYELTGLEQSGVDMLSSLEDYGITMDEPLLTITLNSDGTCNMAMSSIYAMYFSISGETNMSGTYTKDGSSITITIDGDTITGTYSSGKISLETNGLTMIFTK